MRDRQHDQQPDDGRIDARRHGDTQHASCRPASMLLAHRGPFIERRPWHRPPLPVARLRLRRFHDAGRQQLAGAMPAVLRGIPVERLTGIADPRQLVRRNGRPGRLPIGPVGLPRWCLRQRCRIRVHRLVGGRFGRAIDARRARRLAHWSTFDFGCGTSRLRSGGAAAHAVDRPAGFVSHFSGPSDVAATTRRRAPSHRPAN